MTAPVGRIAFGVFALLLSATSAYAHPEHDGSPPPISFVRGKVSAAEHFALDPAIPFAIVVIEDPAQADPFPIALRKVDVVPFEPKCRKYFAIFATSALADLPKLVGKTVEGVVAVALDKGKRQLDDKSECVLVDGLDHVVPSAKKISGERWNIPEDAATLAAIARARSLFEPDATMVHFFELTPIDSLIDLALGEMKSRDALELAITLGMHAAIKRNVAWRNDPTAHALFEKALFDRAWPKDEPHPQLLELFWNASPTKARAKLLDVATAKPALAANVLWQSPLRVEATSLFEELVGAGRMKFALPHRMALLGTETAFLLRYRADVSERDAKEIDRGIATDKERRDKGIVDGWSLVRWVAQNKVTLRAAEGMRVSIVGTTSSCCDVKSQITEDVALEAKVACDAEAFNARCGAPPATITATGVVKRVAYRANKPKEGGSEQRSVSLELEHASIADGGEIPPVTTISDTASSATISDTASSASDEKKSAAPPVKPSASTDCGCATADDADARLGVVVLIGSIGFLLSARLIRRSRVERRRG